MHMRIRHAVVLGALVVLCGACGSDAYVGLTKAEFLQRANRTCDHPTKSGANIRDQLKIVLDPNRRAKLYLDEVLPRLDREIDRIAKLKPPEADRDTVKKILDLTRDDAETLTKNLKDDPKAALDPPANPFATSGQAATDYGLKVCAA